MPNEDDELEPGEQHPAEQRIAKRDEAKAQRELAVVDAGLNLSKDQRIALLAVAGDDLSADNLKAKAESLNFLVKEEAPPPPPPADPALDAQSRMDAAADGSSAPPPPTDVVKTLMGKALYVNNPAELSKLQGEAEMALRAAGYQIGQVFDHNGTFERT